MSKRRPSPDPRERRSDTMSTRLARPGARGPDVAPRASEELVYGRRAALAIFAARPSDIVRVSASPSLRHELAQLASFARAHGVPFAEMDDRALARVADSDHHEGVCVATRPRPWTTPAALTDALVRDKSCALALDRVRNPYNTGAILRSAAFFGLPAVILGAQAPHPALSPQAVRVAEGGAEHVRLTRTTDLGDTLSRMRARGVRVLGADGAAKDDLREVRLSGPVVVVMGNEREGLLARVRDQCDGLVALRGTGQIESLNVAVAATLVIDRMLAATGPRPGVSRA